MGEKLPLYLGLDFSTQQLKAVCVDQSLAVVHEYSVEFDKQLPEFRTTGGVHEGKDGLTVTTPTLLWVKALDLLLDQMSQSGFPFGRVVGVSGCGQQHGSVFWRHGAEQEVLSALEADRSLHSQLQGWFSVPDSPVWKDSSTGEQCRQLEQVLGGPQQLAWVTGSRGYERFTGNQIARIFQEQDTADSYKDFRQTERISLVSSFAASLLLGRYAPIDYSDGSGMNLMDISTKQWSPTALEACAPGFELQSKLGNPVPATTVLGPIAPYYVAKFGLSLECQVVAFTGDNPATLAGMRLTEGDIVVSLGTSDTLIVWINSARPQLMGHVFVNPVDENAYMGLLCYKNGSKTREKVRDACAGGTWEEFDRLLDQTSAGNNGNIGIYFYDPEITPAGQGQFRWDSQGETVPSFTPEVEVRAIVEGQFMAKWVHAQKLGYSLTTSSRVLATGGASKNLRLLQVIADIFGADVYILKGTANSASLGGAYQAKHALTPTADDLAPSYSLAVQTRPQEHKVYEKLCEHYAQLEDTIRTDLPPCKAVGEHN